MRPKRMYTAISEATPLGLRTIGSSLGRGGCSKMFLPGNRYVIVMKYHHIIAVIVTPENQEKE